MLRFDSQVLWVLYEIAMVWVKVNSIESDFQSQDTYNDPITRLLSLLTWLILPVVICSFRRLSHACLSISFYTTKLRIAH